MDNIYYLKNNVIAEPLINQWYAHSFLISPAPFAMLTTYSHLPILKSYLDNPQSHEQALEFREMIGGPFVALRSSHQEWVNQLLKSTQMLCAQQVSFAQAIKNLMSSLKGETNGKSLDSFYQRLPPDLKGYVELYYNLVGQAHFRLLEPLLYYSSYYQPHFQSVQLRICKEDFRPFSLSTPRAPLDKAISIRLPFSHSLYNRLFSARFKPISTQAISDMYEQIPHDLSNHFENFLDLFTDHKPQSLLVKNSAVSSNKNVQIQYLGHACLLIKTEQVTIMTDPVISYPFEHCSPRFTYADLPDKIDYLLITHNHQDHVLIEHLLQLRCSVDTVIVPRCGAGDLQDPSLKLLFKHLGFSRVVEVDDLDTLSIPGGYLTAIPFLGEHGDFNIRTKTTYAIHLNDQKILCIADSVALDETLYQHVHQHTGDIDILFLSMECDGATPTWLYGAFLPEPLPRSIALSRKLNASDCLTALRMIDIFNCKKIYLYAMGQEPWLNYIMNVQYMPDSIPTLEINKLQQICQKRNIEFNALLNYQDILLS